MGDKAYFVGGPLDGYAYPVEGPYASPDSTAMTAAVAAGGAVDAGAHDYRIRYIFGGYRTVGPANGVKSATTATTNLRVNLSAIPIPTRPDYVGFQVERTKVGGTAFFLVAQVINSTQTTYSDLASDASLQSTDYSAGNPALPATCTVQDARRYFMVYVQSAADDAPFIVMPAGQSTAAVTYTLTNGNYV